MIQTVIENEKKERLSILPAEGYQIVEIDGLADIKANISRSNLVNADGSVANNKRVEERNIVFYIKILGDIEKNRSKLRKYFPIKKNITMYFETNTRKLSIEGVVESNNCNPFSNNVQAQISVICTKPYFAETKKQNVTFSGKVKNFQFPFSIPKPGVELGYIVRNTMQTVYYEGEAETGITIELFTIGEVENPKIYNRDTHESFLIAGKMLQGDKITINTVSGKKSVTLTRGGVENNIINWIQRPTSWFKINQGDNVFVYDADTGVANLNVVITYTNLYEGV